MTRYMLDSLNPDDIPLDVYPGALIAAYLGHSDNPNSYAQAVARFPGRQIVSIAAKTHHDAQILDIEHGAVEPDNYPVINDWCHRQVARLVYPTLYANTSTWPGIVPHLEVPVNWWAARWSPNLAMPAGASGLQFGGEPGYDVSIMLDYIPGIDPAQPVKDGAVTIYNVSDGNGHTYLTDALTTAMHVEGETVPWVNAEIAAGRIIDAPLFPPNQLADILARQSSTTPPPPQTGAITGQLTITYPPAQ